MAADVIAQLANADTAGERLAGLRILKNDVVGHVQKKEQWVQAGVLRPLVSILSDDLGDDGDGPKTTLQALQLLATFASAGAPFLPPIHAAGALPAILSCLQDPRPQIVLTALRVLRDVTEASASAPSFSPLDPTVLADILFTSTYLESLATILAQPDTTRDVAAQITIVARLITKLCREEKHQYMLVNYGVLDGLATRLASFAVAEGQVVPRAEITARIEGLSEFIPSPANPSILLSDVLGAIAAIVTDSAFRACRLLYSPSILAVFPNTDSEWGEFPVRTEPLELAGLQPTKQRDHEPMDFLLPYMPVQLRSQTVHSSPLPSLGTNGRASASRPHASLVVSATDEAFGPAEEERVESPLVPWLINLVRNRDDKDALMAASVLTSLYKCGSAYKSRESILGLLVIPKLLQLLEHAQPQNQDDLTKADLDIIEQTPAVLDRLVTDSEPLQKAASDSNAVKTLCKLLKSTYDTSLPSTTPQLWSPGGEEEPVPLNIAADCRLGEAGPQPLLAHHIRLRESTLKALGSLASFKEEYRKAIVDQDVVPYIVESLSPTPGRPRRPGASGDSQSETPVEGSGSNPKAVIIAACYAVRMLSRSVNILRTSLIDHAVAIPIYTLLRHRDLEVQIAATAAICNLVADFSPMRETLARTSILGVLCGHAKSTSPALRLNALWALKHFVNSATTNLKKTCLEELQPGWLVQLICDDQEDEALFSARTGDDRQSSVDDLDEEMEMDDPSRISSFQPSNARVPTNSRIVRLAEAKLATLREAELNPVRKARQDDLAIQEQGLSFIRNLISSSHSSSHSSADSTNDMADMIDFLFSTLGQDRFFNILETKLKVKVLRPFSGRRGATGSEASRVLYPQAKIIEAVVYILVHMAASIPRHRQLVITQTELLRLLAGLFNSKEREVRVALCHLVNNLTWQDDANDAPACSQRAVALKKLGFLTKLESLGHDDELDVRERAKSALWQIKHNY